MVTTKIPRPFGYLMEQQDNEEYEQTLDLQRWGSADLLAFEKALHYAQGDDQKVAVFAIGSTHSQWAKDLLLPFLHHDDPGVRWAAALSLGEMKEKQAWPMLIQMLQEFLPPPYTPLGEVGPDWFEVRHMHVASILGRWGDAAAIPALQETLARVWQIERDMPEHVNRAGLDLLWHYQDDLAYALGQLNAFDVLSKTDISLPQRRLWTVNIALGFLNAREYCKHMAIGIVQEMVILHHHQDLYALLLNVLQQKSGLTLREATEYVQHYNEDYYEERWEKNRG